MHDVVIVGAGPVGLFLACELGLAGCSVLVLEREPEPRSPWKADPLGMRGLSATSVEAFYRRGMLHPLLKTSGVDDHPGADEPAPPRGAGHFAGMMLDPAKVDWDGSSRRPCTGTRRTGFSIPTPASAIRSWRGCSTGRAPRRRP
ncbi:FAD-dependent oxidoreductase [Microbispora sp. CA-102843]|uniref:FAD-dependent oxidoreductase n=1 Tax=Microbispora sp. CA-102843 TaxID=3239952 RepID=UPI003D8E6F93